MKCKPDPVCISEECEHTCSKKELITHKALKEIPFLLP